MKIIKLTLLTFLSLLWFSNIIFAVETPSYLTLEGERGGRLNGSPWSSDELRGKVTILFYVDPDHRDLNKPLADRLNQQDFPDSKALSMVIINMAATWVPDMILQSLLKEKQDQYPETLYINDFQKVLVNEWGLSDDAYHVMVSNHQGDRVFHQEGQFNQQQIDDLLTLIWKSIDSPDNREN